MVPVVAEDPGAEEVAEDADRQHTNLTAGGLHFYHFYPTVYLLY